MDLAEQTQIAHEAKLKAREAQELLSSIDHAKAEELKLSKMKSELEISRTCKAIAEEVELVKARDLSESALKYRDDILNESLQLLASAWIERLKTREALSRIYALMEREIMLKYNAGMLTLTPEEQSMVKTNLLPMVLKNRLASMMLEFREDLNLEFEPEETENDMMNSAIAELTKLLQNTVI